MSDAPLALYDVCKHFGELRAVQGVSLQMLGGERRALIGPNGAGKTTLFDVVSGLQRPTSGHIAMFGQDVTRLPMHRRIGLGLARTFQLTTLFRSLSVEENVLLALQGNESTKFSLLRPLGTYGRLHASAQHLLEEWGFIEKRQVPVQALSYGEQRALEIVLAIAQRPRLLLLDEPTAGLSPAETASATSLIAALPRDIAILLIEHDLDVVFGLCDTMTVLHLGEVLASGDPEEVRANNSVQEIYFGADRSHAGDATVLPAASPGSPADA
jgi:branched-chain amino acid transport system ATP-binding protein